MIDDGGDYHITYKLFYNDLQGRNQVGLSIHPLTSAILCRFGGLKSALSHAVQAFYL